MLSILTQSPETFIRRYSTIQPWAAISHLKVWTQQRLFRGYGQVNKSLFRHLLHKWWHWCETRCAAAVCLFSLPGVYCPWQLNQSWRLTDLSLQPLKSEHPGHFKRLQQELAGNGLCTKAAGGLNALLLQLSCGLCDTLNHLSFYCSDHSLSKYAITTTLLIVVFTFVKKNKLGPGSLITKPSVNLWPQCWSKNTVSMMTMFAKPFWLIISEIPPSLHQRTTP